MADGLVIVGGSYAAAQIAAAARQAGYAEPIRMFSAEDVLPYQRPPLSKAFLTGNGEDKTLPLRADSFYRDQNIDVELNAPVAAIDRAARRIVLESGKTVAYDKLALAVGARPRPLELPGAGLEGVFALRTLADARRIKESLAATSNVVVIGGGFIGLEVASAAAKLGKQVTVLEAQERLLGRACPPVIADWIAKLHAGHGVAIRCSARIASLEGPGRVRAVKLADGSEIPAEVVIVGIGVLPNVELAQAAGLACDNGIVVDRFARTSDPDIVAAGDCTRFPSPYAEAPVRLESVQNATDQSRSAVAAILGQEMPHENVPWFWSDQYDMKLQMTGLSQGHDVHAVRGSMDEGRFSVFYFKRGALIGTDSINRPADHMLSRRLVAARAKVSPSQAEDASFDLKSLMPV